MIVIRAGILAAAAFLSAAACAPATQLFAKETQLSCQACHTWTMGLTPLGKGFRNSNLRLMKLARNGGPAFALRGQFAYTSEPDPSGLPKTIVDEVDTFIAGQVAKNFSYYGDVYHLDGGVPGSARELWVEYASDHQRSARALRLTAGLIALPTPVDPESFRELSNHYAIWDQTVGANPFTFIDPHNALMASFGNPIRGTNVSVAAVQAHDPLSGLPSDGIDTMEALRHTAGPFVLDAYRYDGRRPTGTIGDTFWRNGIGGEWYAGRFQLLAVSQNGYDSSAGGDGVPAMSGGGFVQARYAISPGSFMIGRYDGTEDSTGSFSREFTLGYGMRVGNNYKLEFEDVMQHVPQTTHTLNIVFGFGFANVGGSQAY